jgi:hypothetical protein
MNNDVAVSNIKPNPNQIMANVKANLSRNYTTGEKDRKKCFIENQIISIPQ